MKNHISSKIVVGILLMFMCLPMRLSAQIDFFETPTRADLFNDNSYEQQVEKKRTRQAVHFDNTENRRLYRKVSKQPFSRDELGNGGQQTLFSDMQDNTPPIAKAPPTGGGNPQKIPVGNGILLCLACLSIYGWYKRR